MSQIFDALQRAEADRAGSNGKTPLVATEILARAEKLATTEWEKEDSNVAVRKIASAHSGQASVLHAAVAGVASTVSIADAPLLSEVQVERTLQGVTDVALDLSEESRLVSVSQQDSPTAEAFRLLSVRIRDLRKDKILKKILVTSTLPQEGKSTVAANLACALAQAGKERVLLLEGDVRRPSQSKLFGLGSLKGMCEWLQGEQDLTECLYHLKAAGIWILPAGSTTRNPLDLLQSAKVASMMSRLEGLFDTIVIDSPPVLPLADTSMWTRIADGILLVVREGTTQKRQLQKGIEAIEKEKLIGALLNCARHDQSSYYYY